MRVSRVELAVSAAAAGAIFLIFQYAEKEDTAYKKNAQSLDGTDPNFKGGNTITKTNKDTWDTKLPSCQVWDSVYQAFVNSGDLESDSSAIACFDKNDDSNNPRYIDRDGSVHYRRKDPLSEDPAEAGICFYNNNGTLTSKPSLGGATPVNRSRRLCFASGTTALKPVYFERLRDSEVFFAPGQYARARSALPWATPFPDLGTELDLPAKGPFCMQYGNSYDSRIKSYTSIGQQFWYTTTTRQLDTVDQCLNDPSVNRKWVDPDTNKIAFNSPFGDGRLEEKINM